MEKQPIWVAFFCNPADYKKKAQGTRHKEQERSKEQGPKAKKGTRLEGLLISQKFPLEIIIELYQISQNTFRGFSLYLHPLISIRSCSSTE